MRRISCSATRGCFAGQSSIVEAKLGGGGGGERIRVEIITGRLSE